MSTVFTPEELAAAREAAVLRRTLELQEVLLDPEGNDWPEFAFGRLLDGEQGVSKAALARALGCTPASLDGIIGDPIGTVWTGMGSSPVKTYDPGLLQLLAAHPKVVASRKRRSLSVEDDDRRQRVQDFLGTSLSGELRRVAIRDFRSIQSASFKVDWFTVLFGRNGAGKTSILNALRLGGDQRHSTGVDVSFEIGLRSVGTLSDALEVACYLSLGTPRKLRCDVETVVYGILTAPAAVGRPGEWYLAASPALSPELRRTADRLDGQLRSTVLSSIALAVAQSLEVAQPIPPYPLSTPFIYEVLEVSADADAVEERLFERIAETIESAKQSARFIPNSVDPSTEMHEPEQMATNSETASLQWIDEHANPIQPALATHIQIQLADGTSSPAAPLIDAQDIRRLFHWAVEHADADPSLRALYPSLVVLARFGVGEEPPPWSPVRSSDRSIAEGALVRIEAEANRLAPKFVTEQGRIVLAPPHDDATGRAAVFMVGRSGVLHRISQLPSGVARWVGLVIEMALGSVEKALIRAARSGSWAGIDAHVAFTPNGRVFVVDEPEMHLHPAAQEEVVAWLADLSRRENAHVIVASHAPPFLRIAASEGRINRVSNHHSEGTKVLQMDGHLLEDVDSLADELGLGRDRLLQLVRGMVIVEGPTDKYVLSILGADVLARHRLVVVPIGGHSAASGVVSGELAAAIGLPIAVLFDDITSSSLKAIERDRDADVPSEVKSAMKLLDQRGRGLDCTIIPFEAGDICAALPEPTIRAMFPRFPGWSKIEARHRSDTTVSFKHAFLDALQVSRREDAATIRRIADEWDGHAAPPQVFRRALEALDAWGESLTSAYGANVRR
jgi:energy-coupling factor transporter ATP-binding protein EcfA2